MATIKLRNENTGWCAQFVNDANIVELFGTDTLPTAFTAAAPFELVRSEIQKLNPNHDVIGEA